MDNLMIYAAIAEIFSATAIVGGALFGTFQIAEFRKRRRCQAAVDLCRGFTEPELAKAMILLKSMPDQLGLEDIKDMDKDFEEAAQLIGMTFETMGLLVHEGIASFRVVQELTGGLFLMMWRKSERWIKETRVEQGNPRFGEWMEWLADRLEEREADMVPAYEAHKNWSG
jgi:hypothetical protein